VQSANSLEQNSILLQQSAVQDDAEVKPDNILNPAPEEKKPEIIKYTIKTGDTLESIAKSYDVKVSTISESSGISVNSILREGQELHSHRLTEYCTRLRVVKLCRILHQHMILTLMI
jgi:LysM repeat protein